VLSANIRILSIDNNPGISEHLFGYLVSEDSALKHLSLRMNGIQDAGAKVIATGLKTNKNLISLSLWKNCIGKEGAGDLAEVRRRTGVTWSNLVCVYACRNDLMLSHVQRIGGYWIFFKFLNKKALKFNSTLMSLDLGHNTIKDEGAIAFSKVLSNAPLNLEELQNRRKIMAELERIKKEQDDVRWQ
jgi:Ran GTPase-activating protein (RanGAP) involved in mRNA processing and transport